MTGTPSNDKVFLGDNDHTVDLGDGNDSLFAGDGDNNIDVGKGDNRVSTGHGNNAVLAAHGSNRVFVGDGENTIDLGDGSNRIVVGDGNNWIELGDGDNYVATGDGNNRIDAGDGHNRMVMGDGHNSLRMGHGNDRIVLGTGASYVEAGDGDNVVKAFGRRNYIETGDGNDVVALVGDEQYVVLGDGIDRVTIDGSDNTVEAGDGETRIAISGAGNKIYTGDGDNRISLGDGVQEIHTGSGFDRILFGDGDVMITDTGGDTRITGGDGSMNLDLGHGDTRIRLGDGDHYIRARDGDDRITLGNGYTDLSAGDGNSRIRTGDGVAGMQSRIRTGDGDDTIVVGDHDFSIGTDRGNDIIRTGDGDNWISTGEGNDRISTGDGHDLIGAGAGDDIIRSGDGDDFIQGGSGNDLIFGGAGMSDTAFYAGGIDDYQIEVLSNGKVIVTAREGTRDAGDVDTLTGIESLSFEDDRDSVLVSDLEILSLADDMLAVDGQDPASISLASLQANDTISGETTVTVSARSDFGAEVSFDGTTVTYHPGDMWRHLGEGETATDSFTYDVITSGGWQVATATVDVTITGIDDPIVAGDDVLSGPNLPPSSYASGDEISLHASTADHNSGPRSAALPDGGFATVWAGPGASGGTALQLSIVSDSGVVTTKDLQVTEPGDYHLSPDIAVTADGTLVMIWLYRDRSEGVDEKRLQFFDPDGHPKSEIIVLGQGKTEVTALENGNVLVTAGSYGTVYNSDGNVVVDDFSLPQNPADSVGSADAAALPGGGFVTVFKDDGRVEIRIFDAAGNSPDAEQVVYTPANGYVHFPHVFSDSDGKFGVTWFEQVTVNGKYSATQRLQLYDADANPIGSPIDVSDSVPYPVDGEAAWLSDGRFVVTWVGGERRNVDLVARIFNSDGTPHTDEFYVDTNQTGHQHDPDILVLSEGRFAITWSDETGSSTARHGIKVKIFEPEGGYQETAFVTEDEIADIFFADLLANDSDADNFELSILDTSASSAFGATITIDHDRGIIHYDPTTADDLQALESGEAIEDSFSYTVTNGDGDEETATVSILVGGVDEIEFHSSIQGQPELDLLL